MTERELIQEVRRMVASHTDCNVAECDGLRGPDVYCGCERDAVKLIETIRAHGEGRQTEE